MKPIVMKITPDDAQTVKDGWQVERQRDFRGGETEAILPEAVGRNQLLRMENVLLFSTGYLSAFFQMDQPIITGATPGVCLNLAFGGTYKTYYAPGDGKVYSGTVDTASDVPFDVTTGTGHAVTGAYITGVSKPVLFLGKHYTVNPNPDNTKNGVLNLDDFTLTTIAGKTAKLIRVYTNRIWIVNTDGTIQISNNGDATTYDPLNILWLPNQEPAIDFIPVQGGAIVYGVKSIYAMYGSDYTDITFVPLLLGKQFTSGNVEINGTVYLLSTEGIYAVTLNGAQLLPHNQPDYFKSIFSILISYPSSIDAIYLQNFHAIMFTWSIAEGGTQALIFYYGINAYSKAYSLLPSVFPYMLALNDINTDFLIGIDAGKLAKSAYPSLNLQSPRLAVLQTRHEDAESTRQKQWSEFGIRVLDNVFGVTIEAMLDYSPFPILIVRDTVLQAGDNLFNLNNAEGLASGVNFPTSGTISIRLTFNSSETIAISLVNETTGNPLTNETNGNTLIFDSVPGNFTIQELRLKYCLTGPDI